MAHFSSAINGVTLNTSNDTRTIVTRTSGGNFPGGSFIRIREIFLAGEASSSTPTRVAVNRSTAGTTPSASGSIALQPLANLSAAANFFAYDTWSVQPTLSTGDVLTPTFNAFGGSHLWKAPPGMEIVLITSAAGVASQISIRSRSGTPTASGHVIVEEL